MNLNEKLDYLSKVALKEAEKKKEEVNNEMEQAIKDACQQIQAQEKRKADALINEEKYKTDQSRNKEIMQASIQAKSSLIELRNQLIDDLFSNVIDKLTDYIESEEYHKKLIEDIKSLNINYEGKIDIYLCSRDMVFEEEIKAFNNPNINLVEAEDSMLGGYKAIIKDKRIVVNNSFKEKLDEARNNFAGFRI